MRAKVILLIITCLFIGMNINIPNEEDESRITQDKLKEFEDKVIIKENDYEAEIIEITPSLFNKTGSKVEELIDKGFGFFFGKIKGMIDE